LSSALSRRDWHPWASPAALAAVSEQKLTKPSFLSDAIDNQEDIERYWERMRGESSRGSELFPRQLQSGRPG
jgi:hypothetical protein